MKCEVGAVRGIAVKSHPSRGAWIEIAMHAASWTTYAVAPLAGCVD